MEVLSPTPHYYSVRDRAAEIARSLGSPATGPEHVFLAMLHDGGWPLSAVSGMVDLASAESAVYAILGGPHYVPPTAPPLRPRVTSRITQPLWGVRVAAEMGASHLGLEHALVAMIRDRETVPARALAGLADLDALDAAVVEAASAPVRPHDDAAFLPAGQVLDGQLLAAIPGAVPEGAAFGFNSSDGRTWIHVWGPNGSLGREVSRAVLNTALVSLGRPGLDAAS